MLHQLGSGLSVLNPHPVPIEGPRLLHHLVRQSSSNAGPAIDFLKDGSMRQKLSYESLHILSDDLAKRIYRTLTGLKHTSAIIPVFLPQCPELYITLLAILKAGKAFCPLGIDTPKQRLSFILKDITANLVITTSTLKERIPLDRGVEVLVVDQETTQHKEDSLHVEEAVHPKDLAYVLYTSGSTGLPKAVSVSHRAVTQSLMAHDQHIPRFSRFLQFAAPTFDVSIFEIFFPLFRGCTLVGCTRAQMLNDLPGTIKLMEIDAAELTPTVVSNLLRGRASVPGLKLLLTIGEMLTRHVVQEFGGDATQKSILWGMYGPTEAAIHCTLQPHFQSDFSVGNIGFPLETVSAFIVTPALEGESSTDIKILPTGEVGELVVGGPQVAEEYLNRPELTAAAFLRHPKFGVLYRTGDKARLLPSGTLECLGRIVSGQVKVRGQRVELGEIEQIISKVDGCHTVSVVVIEDTLVAFCAVGSSAASKSEVINTCNRWLPSYMVPADIIFVPCMPQLASGKIDKKELEAQYVRDCQVDDSPGSKLPDEFGRTVQRILEHTLGRKITLSTAFSYAGVDSLRSIQIASSLREKGYRIGAVDVLSSNNLEELLTICKSERAYLAQNMTADFSAISNAAMRLSDLDSHQTDIVDIIPCTPLQEAMLAETIGRPDAYCNWIETELPASYTFSQVRGFFDILAKENEILRSGFCVTSSLNSSSFAQVVWKALHKSQIIEVTNFSKKFSLSSMESLFRPFTVQVNATSPKTRLVFQIHHALYDGWSFDLLLKDFANIIRGRSLDSRPQFRQVVTYYEQLSSGAEKAESISFWAHMLKGYCPEPLRNFNGKTICNNYLQSLARSSSVNVKSLHEGANNCTVNPQVFFQAALAYILGSYLGSTDVVIGTVTSGRTIPVTGIENIMGPCIASLPLRVDLSKCSTIKDILDRVQNSNRAMLSHATLPLRDIIRSCGVPPDSHLFEVLFVWQETIFSKASGPFEIKTIGSADDLEFKLTLEFEPRADCVSCRATYDSSVLPETQVKYLLQHIDELVNHFLEKPTAEFNGVSHCFSPQSLSIANPSPQQTSFSHGPAYAVERWAAETPDKEAVIFGTIFNGSMVEKERLTYSALNSRANQLAHALQERGIGGDSLICVLLEKSVNLYVAILAILKVGSGYLPILPDSPPERITKILSEAQVNICLSETPFLKDARHEGSYLVLDLDTMDTSTYPDQNLSVEYDGSYLAYAIFTSGSTGAPKGVLVTQENLMSNLEVLLDLYPTPADSRLLQACSQAFDVSVFEIFFTWYAGLCLCSATKDDLYQDFEAAIVSLGVTHLSLTPTVASLVNPKHVPKVRFLVTAGEALTEHVRRQWAGKGLYQGYGPSETTNICTVRASVTMEDAINNIGAPFRNTSAFVLDPRCSTIVPRGGIGELCFGGAQVFRGYLNMPELNARKIINHPSYGRIYRSGDMGVLLPDDSILFTGRSDDQIKIRGQRVELGEVTSCIIDCVAVEDCVTLLFQQTESSQKLVTFWVPTKASAKRFELLPFQSFSSAIQDIFESLAPKLPTYMIPSHLIPITQIPVTSQTKVDKKRLFQVFQDLSSKQLELVTHNSPPDNYDGELSEQERPIAEALAGSIGVPLADIQRNSSFFNVGLDSISAIRFSRKLQEIGIGAIPVSVILKNASVARLSSKIRVASTSEVLARRLLHEPGKVLQLAHINQIRSEFEKRGERVKKILPCTSLQEAMLSSAPSATCSSYYNTMVFEVTGEVSKLKKCWTLMFQRHEIFRTAFVPTDDKDYAFAQVVLEYEDPIWDELESIDDTEAYVERTLSHLLRSFKPPVRLATLESSTSTKLVFCCHHALYDGQAISSLLQEVQQAYYGSILPPSVPYERYLQHMISQDFIAADQFWKTSLAGLEPTSFPDLSGTSKKYGSSVSSPRQILHVPLQDVLMMCQDSSVSLLSMIQAAWGKLLHFYTGETNLCFGNVVSGRSLPGEDLDQLIAPCFNTLPVRLNLNAARTHLFDTLVILQQPSNPLDESIWRLERDAGDMNFPIVCEVSQSPLHDQLSVTLHHQTHLVSETDAHMIVKTFSYALSSCVQFPSAAAGDTFGFPSDILARSNFDFVPATPTEGPGLHSAFEGNASLRSNQVALDFQHDNNTRTTWTFGELNAKANQIAHALIERNIGPEDIIPVYIQKSPQFYACILGVLKAGAAFTPLHPELPEARKKFMLSEIHPKVLLCVSDSALDWCRDVEVVNVDTLERNPTENPVIQGLASTNLAYCLYTSGSTGVPKAVGVEHRSPIQTIESSRPLVPWSHDSRLLQYAAITFDMCYYDCFLAWTFGFALCTAEQNALMNNITHVVNSLNVDLLDLTPSIAAGLSREDVPGVKWLYCIGETMVPDIVQRWEGACVNSYGPTEAAFCTTIFPVRKDIKNTVIGMPFPTTSFAVFPKNGERALPVLGVGELYIGGAQIARGYYNNSALTEERFVYRSGQRFYKSGDMVRMLSDGNFEFIGRADDQVKIRGLRVELGEISHVLQECDEDISSVTTQILRKDADAKQQLVAFLVTTAWDKTFELKIKAKRAATDHLPFYMVPQFFIFIEKIPKSMAGKVDKKALGVIFQDSEDTQLISEETMEQATSHSWTETENQVRTIFARLSGTQTECIHPTTSIHQLGLDSISAVQIAAGLRRKGYEVHAVDVLKYTSCVELAACLDRPGGLSSREAKKFNFQEFDNMFRFDILKAFGIKDEDVEAVRPCTPLQRGIISRFIAREGTVYYNYLRLRLNDDIDAPRLRQAWSLVMKKHQMLRTGFAELKDSNHSFAMVQFAATTVSLPWDEENAKNDPQEVDEWYLQSTLQTLKQLHRPPWRIRFNKENGQAHLHLAIFHAIFDAESLQAIFTDVSRAYNDLPLGIPTSLEPLLDMILTLGASEDIQRTHFWEKLGKGLAVTRFPNVAPLRYNAVSPAVVTKICSTSVVDLEAGCRKSNITLQAAGIASWASILSAYTGESSVTCGVVLSGRNVEAAESAVFPCITTMPFVCKVGKDKRKMLRDIMALNAEIQRHQFTPLNEIQRMMGHPNEPLFDTIFAFQKIPNKGQVDMLWEVVDERASVDYPISIELEPVGERVEIRLTFLPHMIPREQAALILGQLDHLLAQFVFSEVQSPNVVHYNQDLYSITPAREHTIPSKVSLLHELVEIFVNESPSRIALEFASAISNGQYTSKTWTYTQLNSEANRIAHMLISHGVKPGGLVGICFDKCPEASFAILGILKAGAAFVALDPGAPSRRRAFIVKDSGAIVVMSMITQSTDLIAHLDVPILNLDEMDLKSTPVTKPVLERDIVPQDRSYCLYTSGTTGTPKGCELTHENAVQAMLSFQRIFAGHWNEDSRWLQFASFHFDVSVLEQFWSWSVGICVVSAPRDLIFEDLATSIRVLGITHIDLTPSLAQTLHPDDVPSLCKGVFITGGESLKQEILDVWGPKGVIYNGYGPTEATIGVTMYPRVPATGKPSNIGPQFDNVGSYVLTPNSDVPVLRGGVGELCVSGKLVGKGYLNRPELTLERFPHIPHFNERVYRTGDLVRILHDGTFDFLGRADDQVKLRGQRLEIGEINSVIKQFGLGISDVATLILKHPRQQKDQLVSFVVTTSRMNGEPRILIDGGRLLEDCKEACHEKLPGYMVPTHFIALSAMPLSASNKAEVRKLREMYNALTVSDLQALAGTLNINDMRWSMDEEKIRKVLKDMLHLNESEIKKSSSIFELGLDSVSVIGFVRALKQVGFSNATASTVMKNTSIARLAKVLKKRGPEHNDRGSILAAQQSITATQHRHRRAVAEALHMDPRNIEALAPCTPLQQGMIARSLDSEKGLYFNTFRFNLSNRVQEHALRFAWQEVFSATQILRTIFSNTEDGFVQAAIGKLPFPWRSCELSNDDSLGAYLDDMKREWSQQNQTFLMKKPFELAFVATPLRKVLAVHIFHALYDGNSIALMVKTVWEIYNGCWSGKIGPPFQSVLACGPLRNVDGAQNFWHKHLSDNAFRPIPGRIGQSDEPSITMVIREIQGLSKYELARRKLGVTPQAIAQACWATVLHKYVKGTVTLGMVVSGRNIDFEDVDQVIGPLFNTIPYQHRVDSQDTWASLVKKAHDFNVGVHPYQHIPLRDIMKWCKRSPSQPLFDTLFVYQIAEADEKWVKNNAWELIDGSVEADFPLTIDIEQRGGKSLKITLVTQGHVSDPELSNRLMNDFEKTLDEILNDTGENINFSFIEEVGADGLPASSENKNMPTFTDGADDFEWSKSAIAMREEVAKLAGTRITDISETTSIFELGLDSIDAIKLSSRLKKRGIDVPVSGIMRALTIPRMARISSNNTGLIQRHSDMIFRSHKRRLENCLQRRRILVEDIEQVLPLTPLQEAMVAEMVASEYTRYYNHDVLKLAPDTDVEKLKAAWTKLVENSPILRTSFIGVDDPNIDFSFAQVVHRVPHAFWQNLKVEGKPNFLGIFESIRRKAVKASQPGPLFHIHRIDSGDQRYLVLSVSHALYDGWSLGLLHSDVRRSYFGQFSSRPSYDSALQEILTATGSDAAAFWRDHLSEAKPSLLPRRPGMKTPDHQRVCRMEQTSKTDLESIASFAKRYNITLQTVGQTIYALVLASYIQSLDVIFGSVLSGRDNDNMSEILFPTMNTVAIRTILHGTRLEMLRYVQENFMGVKQWQHFPLRKAQAIAGAQGSLFESLFIYQKRLEDRDENTPQLYESVEGQSGVEYPVCVEMEVVDDELIWRCAVKEDVFDHTGAEGLLKRLDTVLKALLEHPGAPTIDFTPAGTSICGLPGFQEEQHQDAESNSPKNEDHSQSLLESPTARIIREVMAFVSKIPEEEITEGMTIFHLGLDSISAIKVSSLLRKRSVILSVGEMLKAATVENMAQLADERTPASDEDAHDAEALLESALGHIEQAAILRQAGMEEQNVEQLLPASAGQIYMLSVWINSNKTIFYPEFSYKLAGSITFQSLQKAWEALVAANPVLRACFVATKDSRVPYVQAVLHSAETAVHDLSRVDGESVSQEIHERSLVQPYAHLFVSESSMGWNLTLKIHHALYDGASLPILMQQLQDLSNGVSSTLSPVTKVFSKFLASSFISSSMPKRKAFWSNYLYGIAQQQPLLPQPFTPSTSKIEIFKRQLLPATRLDSLARQHGLSTQSVFFAIYARLYASLVPTPSDRDVVIGIYLANRSHPSIPTLAQSAIPTVNLVALRVSKPLEMEVWDTAAQIQYDIQEISMVENAGVGLWEVREWTGVKVDTFVNFLKLPESEKDKDREYGTKIRVVGEWEENVSKVVEMKGRGPDGPGWLVDGHVQKAYLHALDIEATIRNGALNVGVFAPVGMIGLEEGEKLIRDLRSELEGLE
ncbi:uncharacterized protein BDR25DRAFT_282295 [Lindgomyces ingoldianus]|uniref:Uncharacterized protein n=1 Tax=Lindgomyces ingoldianus TaxID=673940 RepID=A0ACB6R1B2_9PLEO|nr:uncharacterized protein BDR25DRAFT_282295 [Lindgomyces ingoldianus]KAF2473073.1 hypothetical protein BDR25DRAFT_282295 [Lindgomyces ingoldianus]